MEETSPVKDIFDRVQKHRLAREKVASPTLGTIVSGKDSPVNHEQHPAYYEPESVSVRPFSVDGLQQTSSHTRFDVGPLRGERRESSAGLSGNRRDLTSSAGAPGDEARSRGSSLSSPGRPSAPIAGVSFRSSFAPIQLGGRTEPSSRRPEIDPVLTRRIGGSGFHGIGSLRRER